MGDGRWAMEGWAMEGWAMEGWAATLTAFSATAHRPPPTVCNPCPDSAVRIIRARPDVRRAGRNNCCFASIVEERLCATSCASTEQRRAPTGGCSDSRRYTLPTDA